MRRIPIYRALHRAPLLWGVDRELVLMLGLLAFALIFAAATWATALIGIVLFAFGFTALRMMAKADPRMRAVYLRHIRYRPSYRARAGLAGLRSQRPHWRR